MSNLIDRQEIIKRLKRVIEHGIPFPDGTHPISAEALLEAFEDTEIFPSAQPERETGEWNFVGNQMHECTNCGVAYTEYQFEKMRVRYNDPKFPKFCPNCGADMKGESYGD